MTTTNDNQPPGWTQFRPYSKQEVPDSMRLSPQWINDNPANRQQTQRRRARAQQIVMENVSAAYGKQAAMKLANLVDLYPGMSPSAMTGLVHGEQFIPKGQQIIPGDTPTAFSPLLGQVDLSDVAEADAQSSGLINEQPPAQDQPPGLLGQAVNIISKVARIPQFATTGLMTAFSYPTQAYTGLSRKYYGDIDAALDLQKQYGLTDDELQEMVGVEMFQRAKGSDTFDFTSLLFGDVQNYSDDVYDSLGGNLNPLIRQGTSARGEAFREGAETFPGSKKERLAAAQQKWVQRGLGTVTTESAWNRTALGEWFRQGFSASNPIEAFAQMADGWAGIGEFQKVDLIERGGVEGRVPFYDLRTEQQKADGVRLLQQRMREASQQGHIMTAEEVFGLTSARPYTVGRATLMTPDADPESAAQVYGSGLIDAGLMLLDPTAYIPVGDVARIAKLGILKGIGSTGSAVTVDALRRARPNVVQAPLGDVAEGVDLLGKASLTPEAIEAGKQVHRTLREYEQAIETQATNQAAAKTIEFDRNGRAYVADENGANLMTTTGVREVVGDGWQMRYRSDRAKTDVTLSVSARTSRTGEIVGYRVQRLKKGAAAPSTLKTFDTLEEADAFAKQSYVRDNPALSKGLRDDVAKGSPAQEMGKYLTDRLLATRKARAATLRLSKQSASRWNIVDDSLNPFTEVNIRTARETGQQFDAQVSGLGYRVTEHPDGRFGVYEMVGDTPQLRSTAATVDEATQKVQEALHPLRGGKVTRSKMGWSKASDGVWESHGYTVIEDIDDYGDTVFRLLSFDQTKIDKAPMYDTLAQAKRAAADHAETTPLALKPGRGSTVQRYSVYDGDVHVSSHASLDDAEKAAVKSAHSSNNDLERQIERALTGTSGAESTLRPAVRMLDDQGDQVVFDFTQDVEGKLLRELEFTDQAVTELVEDALDAARSKLRTTPYTTNRAVWDVLEETAFGQKIIAMLINADDAARLKRLMPWMDMDDVLRFTKANNEDTVKALLGQMIGPRYSPDMLASASPLRSAVVRAKYRLGNSLLGNKLMYRPFLFAPKGHTVDVTDSEELYWNVRRFGEGLGVLPDTMDDALRPIIDARTPVERFEVFYGKHGFLETTMRDHLKREGLGDKEINTLLSVYKGAQDIGQRLRKASAVEAERPGTISRTATEADLAERTVEELVDGTYAGPLVVGMSPEEVMFTDELLGKGLTLPDYKTIKRALSGFARIERKMRGVEGSGPILVQAMGRWLNAATSGWRNLTLISSARAVRDIIDMQVRTAIAGGPSLLTDPARFVGLAFSAALSKEATTRTRSFMINAPFFGLPALLKAVNKRLPGVDDAIYRNSFIVSVDSARPLIDPAAAPAMFHGTTASFSPGDIVVPARVHGQGIARGGTGDYAHATVSSRQAANHGGRVYRVEPVNRADVELDPAYVGGTEAHRSPTGFTVIGERTSEAKRDRQMLDDSELDRSIGRDGVLSPIEIVYDKAKNAYAVRDGMRRLSSADRVGASYVPVKVVEGRIPDGAHSVQRASTDANWNMWKSITGSESGYVGGVLDVVRKARQSAAKDRHWSIGYKALAPLLDSQWAAVNGKAWFHDLNEMMAGNKPIDISLIAKQSSEAMGSFARDDNLFNGIGMVVSTFSKRDVKQRELYARALADKLGELRETPHLAKVIDGRMTIDEAVHKIMSNPSQRATYNSLSRQNTLSAMKFGSIEDKLKALRQEDATLASFIKQQLHLQIATYGMYTGKTLYRELSEAFIAKRFEGKGLTSQNRKLVRHIEGILDRDNALPDVVHGSDPAWQNKANALVDRLFAAQGEVYDLFAMHPMQRQLYVDKIGDLMQYATPEARRKVLANVTKRGDRKLSKSVEERMRWHDGRLGFLDANDIEMIAQHETTREMSKIFYDAHARQNYALSMRVLMPFLQSSVNTVYTWGRLIGKDPAQAYRAFRPVKSMMMPDSDNLSELLGFSTDEDPYAVGTGFFDEDPSSGFRTFLYPYVGSAASKMVNALNPGADVSIDARASASSLNPWQSGILPGFNPLAMAPLLTINPDAPAEDNLMGRILRLQGVSIPDDPNFVLRTLQQVMPVKYAEGVMLGTKKNATVYANMYASEIAQGGYDFQNDPAALTDASDRASTKAKFVQFLEGAMQLVLPTAGSFNMEAKVNVGPVDDGGLSVQRVVKAMTLNEMAQEYRKYVSVMSEDGKATFKTGEDYRQGQAAFMRDFGPAAIAGVQRLYDNDLNSPWTLETWDYSQKHPKWWARYRGVASGIFASPDSFGGSLDDRVRQMQNFERQKGRGEYLRVEDIKNAVLLEISDLWAANALQQASAASGGFIDPGTENRITSEATRYANGAEDTYDFDARIKRMEMIEEALADPDAPQTDGAKYILQWLQMRRRNSQYMADNGINKGTEVGNPTSYGSMELYLAGQEFLSRDKSGTFASFWQRYASKDFTDDFKAFISGYGG